jgi:hypothetical protein
MPNFQETMTIFRVMFLVVPILAIVLCILAILSPRTSWHISEGWKYKNLEPSDGALKMIRVGGVLGIIGAIAFIIFTNLFFF